MNYLHDTFSYSGEHQAGPAMYYQPIPYPDPYMQHHPAMDDFYQPYPQGLEYTEFFPHGLLPEDYDESGEISTRPRLTKEQVDVLEQQFQLHPKPNSIVKRQLAMQTNLTLPRVANWFQNRRAKAKQQKKQEEFELAQQVSGVTTWKSDNSQPASSVEQPQLSPSRPVEALAQAASPRSPVRPTLSRASTSSNAHDPSKEASWASLQRAIGAAKAAQQQRAQDQADSFMAMSQLDLSRDTVSAPPLQQSPRRALQAARPDFSDWAKKVSAFNTWSSPQASQDVGFDFGFEQEPLDTSHHSSVSGVSPQDTTQQQFVISPEQWDPSLATPTMPFHSHNEPANFVPSPPRPMPAYPPARRDSMASELAANFGAFALAGSSPHPTPISQAPGPLRQSDGEIDLAGRRKRPRPAALTSASLRSRSYGALTSASPTIKSGLSTPVSHTHSIRHVKSMGNGLNTRYAGIRKPSSAQRSPFNVSSFAEAESFNKLMAQQAAAAVQNQHYASTPTDVCGPTPSPDLLINGQMAMPDSTGLSDHGMDMSTYLHSGVASPPTSPFQTERLTRGMAHLVMPPASAPPQFASFPDYTPPYSAGPLTNSSWSDGPLTSPELPLFPSGSYVPSLNYLQSNDSLPGNFQQFVLPSDSKTDLGLGGMGEQRHTEFCIQEFPGQKEEHAHIAQQVAQQKPKHYVFANSAPRDYDGI